MSLPRQPVVSFILSAERF